ncbi:replication-associated recombination protein A [Leifsonia sp. NPDC058194]|uniref:replication-associated recombination protein A n=1 Tax=Leifsonia sp. NPDC058194 TaxID=3346374 RepID=UPI0036D9C65C
MNQNQPLAARMRPTTLSEVVGQSHLIFPGSPLELLLKSSGAVSVILYGPPGCGKTTIASVIAAQTSKQFEVLSATSAGVADVRKTLAAAQKALDADGTQTLVFIDEIHRFSKAQQDVLLPAVETGIISLIGATTENPSFSVNAALVSRSIMLVLRPVERHDIVALLERALEHDPVLSAAGVTAEDEALDAIADLASGDVRQALNRLETSIATARAAGQPILDRAILEQVTGAALQRYDRDGDQHYDIISAFIKSMRGSDPQATLHWLARMIEAGEDPRFIARRIVVHASEDVGMADPSVLPVAVAAAQAVQLIGMPEARINLAQAALAVATAPKSPAVMGIDTALADVRAGRTGSVPMHLRDAHYAGAKALGHGQGYLFPHDFPHGIVAQQYLPDEALGATYYEPTPNGFEQVVGKRLSIIQDLKTERE